MVSVALRPTITDWAGVFLMQRTVAIAVTNLPALLFPQDGFLK